MNFSRRDVLRLGAALPFSGAAFGASLPQLEIMSRVLEVKGKAAKVFGIIGPDGKHGLSMVYGEAFNLTLKNSGGEETAIHWHGLTPPVAQDGVPMLVGPSLKSGETRAYDFVNKKVGTHWMHSHLGLQEQKLLAAPLIVRETAKPVFDEQEHVVMLHDFTFRDPAEILAELKAGGGGHAAHTKIGHIMKPDMKMDGMKMPAAKTEVMAMGSDISYDAILTNDRTLDDPEIVTVEKGGNLRLRLINAAAATNVWVELGALKAQVIAVDGNAVKPISVSRIPLGIAQRADLRIALPKGAGSWPILFQSEGATLRGGLVLRAGDGAIAKTSDHGKSGADIGLDFESRLRIPYPLKKNRLMQREMVMLTGGEKNYEWGFNGKPMMHETLFKIKRDTRVEVTMHNMTGMAHPMHLHGHYFQVTAINDRKFEGALRDTVLIPPGVKVSIQFDADNPGTWAFHCHHLYHMNSGMMAAVAYT